VLSFLQFFLYLLSLFSPACFLCENHVSLTVGSRENTLDAFLETIVDRKIVYGGLQQKWIPSTERWLLRTSIGVGYRQYIAPQIIGGGVYIL
jgi:hypothetical protein